MVCQNTRHCEGCVLSEDKTFANIINQYLHQFSVQKQKLGIHQECILGTLENLNLCEIAEFIVPTGITCDMKITLHSLEGLQSMMLKQLSFTYDPTKNLVKAFLDLDLGVLEGVVSVVPAGNCGFTGALTAKSISCLQKKLTIGSQQTTSFIKIEIFFPLECVRREKEDVQVHSQVSLGDLKWDCFKLLERLPNSMVESILRSLNLKVSTLVDTFMLSMVDSLHAKLFQMCPVIN
jgi:hypothetical protein